jgi:hypothetical protein
VYGSRLNTKRGSFMKRFLGLGIAVTFCSILFAHELYAVQKVSTPVKAKGATPAVAAPAITATCDMANLDKIKAEKKALLEQKKAIPMNTKEGKNKRHEFNGKLKERRTWIKNCSKQLGVYKKGKNEVDKSKSEAKKAVAPVVKAKTDAVKAQADAAVKKATK